MGVWGAMEQQSEQRKRVYRLPWRKDTPGIANLWEAPNVGVDGRAVGTYDDRQVWITEGFAVKGVLQTILFTPDEWRQIVEVTRSVWDQPQVNVPSVWIAPTPEIGVTTTSSSSADTLGWHSAKGR